MPTLPLYETPQHPDAWHRVTAPGGYEWWAFEVWDAARRLKVRVDFFDGDPFNRAYRRAYRRYRRRPTRVPPPVPRDYPCVRVELRAKGTTPRLWVVDTRYPAGAFDGTVGSPAVRVGACSMQSDERGEIHISLAGLTTTRGAAFSGELAFRPLEPRAAEWRRRAGEAPSIVHFGLARNSGYAVNGTLHVTRGDEAVEAMGIGGQGSYEHYYGTGLYGIDLVAKTSI